MEKRRFLLLVMVLLLMFSCRKKDVPERETPIDEVPVEIAETGLVTSAPAFPSDEQLVTIHFDATKGDAGLKDYVGDVYMHAGVITDKSTGSADWKYVKSPAFDAPDAAVRMTAHGDNKYSISMTPRTFFNVPVGEKILKVAVLFRNGDGSKVGRNKDGSDVYLSIYQEGALSVRFNLPELEPTYLPKPAIDIHLVGGELNVSAISSKEAELNLFLNGNSFATASSAKQVTGKVKIVTGGNQVVKVTATDGTSSAETSFSFVVSGVAQVAELPQGAKDGVTFINGGKSAIFCLYAPEKKGIYVIGDFNEWQADAKYFMNQTPDGNRWWVRVDNLDENKEYGYQYLVDNSLKIADPYCEIVLDPQNDQLIPSSHYPNLKPYPLGKTTGIISVLKASQPAYAWKVNNFVRPQKKDLVIYELHLRDFLGSNNYNTLTDTLNYLSNLGVNAIELMPINEFEGNSSWGYNPSFYFTPDKYYGTKNMLKSLIDQCHERGIAVILDMVLNHSFGQSPMVQLYFNSSSGKPAANSPWFNANPTHPFNVGYDFNHESQATRQFVKNVAQFWMNEYKIDGFRFDLSKGFTQKNSGTSDASVASWSAYDASRVAIWKDYNRFIKTIDPEFYVILEHLGVDEEEKELANDGMMLWNNVNHSFNEATMGWLEKSDFSRAFHSTHGFARADNLITYMESHDEERLMFKNLQYGNASGSYNIKDYSTALKRQEMAAAFLFAIPGPKMIWQFGELGYDISIDQNGRTGEKPVLWNYNSDPRRRHLYSAFSKLIKWKINNAVFGTSDVQHSLAGAVKYIKLQGEGNTVVVVGNFDVVPRQANITFPAAGVWIDNMSGTSLDLPEGAYVRSLAPGEYHVYSRGKL